MLKYKDTQFREIGQEIFAAWWEDMLPIGKRWW